jgi:hypothetical protein
VLRFVAVAEAVLACPAFLIISAQLRRRNDPWGAFIFGYLSLSATAYGVLAIVCQ